jgi:hypothetical protein
MKTRTRPALDSVKRRRTTVVATSVEDPVPHLLVQISGLLDADSMAGIFRRAGQKVAAASSKRVLVDMRECRVALSIADMHGLVKMIAAAFAGTVERLAVVLQVRDILPEKFFEPALTSRGVPTLATPDYAEGLYWLASRLRPGV